MSNGKGRAGSRWRESLADLPGRRGEFRPPVPHRSERRAHAAELNQASCRSQPLRESRPVTVKRLRGVPRSGSIRSNRGRQRRVGPMQATTPPVLEYAVQDAQVPARLPGQVGWPGRRSQLRPDVLHWYNHEHRHSGIGFHTLAAIHHDRAERRQEQRADVLAVACSAHPERSVHKPPAPPQLPPAARINRPMQEVG